MSIELKVTMENDYITAKNDQHYVDHIVYDPCILIAGIDGFVNFIDIEACHDKIYWTGYVTDVVNALIPGEYGVEEFGWSGVSAAELFVLLLMKGYNLQECSDWTDALPDKGERIKQYLKLE